MIQIAHRGHATRLIRFAGSAAWLFLLAAALVPWSSPPAHAQAADVCTNLPTKLKKLGEANADYLKALDDYKKANPDPAKATTKPPAPERYALYDLANRPTPYRVELSGAKLPGDGAAWFAVVDKAVADQNAKLCVRVYWRLAAADKPFEPANVRQAFPMVANDAAKTPKYKVVFDVAEPPNGSRVYSTPTEYLLVGMHGEDLFSYTTRISVTHRRPDVLTALLFVLLVYGFLAWITYDGKDAENLRGFEFFLYLLSPVRISAGVVGDASISQIQVVLFTFIVAGLLFYLWLRTGLLADISNDLLTLLGISAVGAGAAKFTATMKTDLDPKVKAFIIGKGWYNWKNVPAGQTATFHNLLLTGGRLDVYKFQVAIFTLVVAAYVVSSGQNDLGDVKISDTMLYLIGISQGVYIGGKVITDRTSRIEDAVKKMMENETLLADAKKKQEYDQAEETAKTEFAALYQLQKA
ncbi:MAG TPA: hypothetical protein VGL70_15485 [Candidatus Binatia bacterium]|jgi:hypothetical protein